MLIRHATADDIPAIRMVITEALLLLEQSTGTEADIVDKLSDAKALILSLVAEDKGAVVGYLAGSPARIGAEDGWGLIGPLAVLPSRHRQGIGSALMKEAIVRMQADYQGAALVGDPEYYRRFGFKDFPGLRVEGCPSRFVQALPFGASEPEGELIHHPAFGLKQ